MIGSASLKVVDERILYDAMTKDMYARMNMRMPRILSDVKPKVSKILLQSLSNSATVQSLMSGKLKEDFGLFGNVVNVTVQEICKIISENVKLNANPSTKSLIILNTTLELLPSQNYAKLIKAAGGSFPSRGGNVDWLEWILTRGTQVVVGDYWLFPFARGRTRSGGSSVMKEIEKTARDPFRVDPNFAGTLEDNFITRAIQSSSDDILSALAISIDKGLK